MVYNKNKVVTPITRQENDESTVPPTNNIALTLCKRMIVTNGDRPTIRANFSQIFIANSFVRGKFAHLVDTSPMGG